MLALSQLKSQMFRTAIIITHFLMLLLQSNGIFNCFLNSFKFLTLRPVAERIKKLSIKYNIEPEPPLENDAGFNSEKWLAFINYVLSACPNLELLKIHVINQTFPTSPLPFDSRIELISKSINCVVGQVNVFWLNYF
jgi:hypothetical protein